MPSKRNQSTSRARSDFDGDTPLMTPLPCLFHGRKLKRMWINRIIGVVMFPFVNAPTAGRVS